MIIGISGHIGSGKSLATQYVEHRYHLRADSFAASLRDVLAVTTSIPVEETFSTEDKNKIIPLFETTRGKYLQEVGELFRSYREHCWVYTLQLRWETHGKDDIVISDVRFPNEVAFIESMGGIVIRLERSITASDLGDTRNMQHPSETALNDHLFIYKIDNNGSKEDLYRQLKHICDPFFTT